MTCVSALLPVGVAMLGYDIMVYAVYYVLLYSLTFIVATNKCYMHFAKNQELLQGVQHTGIIVVGKLTTFNT